MGSRTKARKRALDLLFEAEQRGVNARDLLDQRVATPVTPAPLPDYTAVLVRGVIDKWRPINEALETYAKGWSLDRMPAVDRALLRVSTYELLYVEDVPDAVVVSEAKALAAELSTDNSPQFIGGLLSKLSEVKTTLVD